jgi:DNA-binding CsgD family transcriptional regulator/PAS domain-containing protein
MHEGTNGKGRKPKQYHLAAGKKVSTIDLNVGGALKILDDIYASALNDDWTRPVEGLAEAFRADAGVLFAQDIETHEVPMVEFTRIAPEAVASYADQYAATNPWIDAQRDMPSGTAVTGEQLVDDDAFLSSAFYNEWLAPQGLRHALGSVVLRDDHTLAKMTLVRPDHRGPYDVDDLAVFRGFVQHLKRALELRERLAEVRWREGVQMELLERLSVGVALLSGTGTVMFANQRLRELVAARDGIDINGNRLTPTTSGARRRFERCIGSALKTGAGDGLREGDTVAIPRPSMRRALIASIIPLPRTAGTWFDDRRPPATAIFISDPEAPALPAPEELVNLYGLTLAESHLTVRVASGYSLYEAASQLGITPESARTVIKRVFCKTDTHSQAQLVRLVLSSGGKGG